MRTEIVVPFAFDTTPIETMLQKQGKDEAMKILRQMVEDNAIKQIPRKETYSGTKLNEPDWRRYMDGYLYSWLNDHTEEIIDEAALLLAARAGRKNKWREILREVKEEDKS